MAVDEISISWQNTFQGVLEAPNGQVLIGSEEGNLKPYNLFLGALGSCFYATFLSLVQKMKLSFSKAEMKIGGVKREEVPTTLKEATIYFKVFNPSNEEKILKAAELGAKYCSIHETISKVAKIDLDVHFEYQK